MLPLGFAGHWCNLTGCFRSYRGKVCPSATSLTKLPSVFPNVFYALFTGWACKKKSNCTLGLMQVSLINQLWSEDLNQGNN